MPRLNAQSKQQRDDIASQMRQMHDDGSTYQEIGDAFGVSRQRVFQMIGGSARDKVRYFRHISERQCVYKGIRKFMNDNQISLHAMTRRLYGYINPGSYTRVRDRLSGHSEITKTYIDKLLLMTGLTYEEAFEMESEAACDA